MSPKTALKISIFLTGFAGIVAEYLLSTLASYLLGDTIFQWVVIISLMLFAMGVGSKFSAFIKDKFLLDVLILVEILISLLVSTSTVIAYLNAPFPTRVPIVIYSLSFSIGFLIGLEIPLAVRINNIFEELKENIASILEKDYLGALPGGILYAYIFLPKLGLTFTPVLVGGINLCIAGLLLWTFSKKISYYIKIIFISSVAGIILYLFMIKPIFLYSEQKLFRDPIIYKKQTKYQQIVLTKWRDNYFLYLDGHLQLSTIDEKRYHETLVHIPMSIIKKKHKILIIGGGDGFALREVLKYHVKKVHLVDIDKDIVNFSKTHPVMRKYNNKSFDDKRVKVFFKDGFVFVRNAKDTYDVIIVDMVDPKTPSAARLYSKEFYTFCYNLLSEDGILITQASSIFFAKETFCCILNTLKETGFFVYPLKIEVPSFGEWGFVLGTKKRKDILKMVLKQFDENKTEYLTTPLAVLSFFMEKNFSCKGIQINTLMKPKILDYYENKLWELY